MISHTVITGILRFTTLAGLLDRPRSEEDFFDPVAVLTSLLGAFNYLDTVVLNSRLDTHLSGNRNIQTCALYGVRPSMQWISRQSRWKCVGWNKEGYRTDKMRGARARSCCLGLGKRYGRQVVYPSLSLHRKRIVVGLSCVCDLCYGWESYAYPEMHWLHW